MIVGVLELELYLPAPNSLKSKRTIIKRIIDRVKNKFNVSVSEIDCHDLWQRSVIGVCIGGCDKRYCNQVLDKVVDTVEQVHDSEVIRVHLSFR